MISYELHSYNSSNLIIIYMTSNITHMSNYIWPFHITYYIRSTYPAMRSNHLCHVIQSDMLHVYHSPTHLFSSLHFSFNLYINWNGYLTCNGGQFLCNFQFLMWLLLLMSCPLIGPFIFKGLVYLYQLVDPGQVICVGFILPCRSFSPSPWCCIE